MKMVFLGSFHCFEIGLPPRVTLTSHLYQSALQVTFTSHLHGSPLQVNFTNHFYHSPPPVTFTIIVTFISQFHKSPQPVICATHHRHSPPQVTTSHTHQSFSHSPSLVIFSATFTSNSQVTIRSKKHTIPDPNKGQKQARNRTHNYKYKKKKTTNRLPLSHLPPLPSHPLLLLSLPPSLSSSLRRWREEISQEVACCSYLDVRTTGLKSPVRLSLPSRTRHSPPPTTWPSTVSPLHGWKKRGEKGVRI